MWVGCGRRGETKRPSRPWEGRPSHRNQAGSQPSDQSAARHLAAARAWTLRLGGRLGRYPRAGRRRGRQARWRRERERGREVGRASAPASLAPLPATHATSVARNERARPAPTPVDRCCRSEPVVGRVVRRAPVRCEREGESRCPGQLATCACTACLPARQRSPSCCHREQTTPIRPPAASRARSTLHAPRSTLQRRAGMRRGQEFWAAPTSRERDAVARGRPGRSSGARGWRSR